MIITVWSVTTTRTPVMVNHSEEDISLLLVHTVRSSTTELTFGYGSKRLAGNSVESPCKFWLIYSSSLLYKYIVLFFGFDV